MSSSRPAVPSTTEAVVFAFAPIHKMALGIATGAVFGLLIFAVTCFHVIGQPPHAPPLALLANYFYGYTITWQGALIGLLWGGVTGFVFGWFAAFVRNLTVALTVFALRTKAELNQTADFLDHI